MRINYARPPSEKIKNTNICIANFPTSFSEEDIKNICSDFGRIISHKLLDGNDKRRGIAFCRYDTNCEAQIYMIYAIPLHTIPHVNCVVEITHDEYSTTTFDIVNNVYTNYPYGTIIYFALHKTFTRTSHNTCHMVPCRVTLYPTTYTNLCPRVNFEILCFLRKNVCPLITDDRVYLSHIYVDENNYSLCFPVYFIKNDIVVPQSGLEPAIFCFLANLGTTKPPWRCHFYIKYIFNEYYITTYCVHFPIVIGSSTPGRDKCIPPTIRCEPRSDEYPCGFPVGTRPLVRIYSLSDNQVCKT